MTRNRVQALDEVFDFRPDEGLIRLHDQRVVILSATAMGLLRKELVETLGTDTTRRLLLRFGFADGYHDAVNLRERYAWADPLAYVRAGATIHGLEGIVQAQLGRLEFDAASGRFRADISWRHSYEAEQHVQHYGPSERPVCWSLVGYVSGYASAALGREIYFQERQCAGQGHRRCTLVGQHAAGWRGALEALRFDYQGADLGAEVERQRVAARRKRLELVARERAMERREREVDLVRQRIADAIDRERFVVRCASMRAVVEMASRVAPLDTTVLISGESGTGKEFVAKLIHQHSARAGGPLVSINCAALTETLLESELFGHVRGAFTGAVRDKPGLFEVAGDGTLFLDEVGDMPPTLQAKLLRAIQEGEIRRVGGERTIKVRPRILAATNRDLRAHVASGGFREDLYFRLAGFVITVPPVRERPEDVPALVHEFLRRARERLKKQVKTVTPEAMTALVTYEWPGNVRELAHAMERAVILARTSAIRSEDLPDQVTVRSGRTIAASGLNLRDTERALVREALRRCRGSRTGAARALGVSTVTLWRMIKRYGLDPGDGSVDEGMTAARPARTT